MGLSISDYISIGGYYDINDNYDLSEAFFGDSKKSYGSSKNSKSSFFDILTGYTAKTESVFMELAKLRAQETTALMKQMLDKMRTESNTRQVALLQQLLAKEQDAEAVDTYGKCLDIASRIILGEIVSADELRLVAQEYPELMAQVQQKK